MYLSLRENTSSQRVPARLRADHPVLVGLRPGEVHQDRAYRFVFAWKIAVLDRLTVVADGVTTVRSARSG